jgi:signal transduction histidine kinase
MNTSARLTTLFSRSKSIAERYIHSLYALLIAPKSPDEDSRRKEFILNTILCGFITVLTILDIFIARATLIKGSSYTGFPFSVFTLIIVSFVYLLALSRNRLYELASFVLLSIYFIAVTYGAIHWGAELPLVSISYIVIIIVSGILISTRFALLLALTSALTIGLITHLQLHGIIHASLDWKNHPVRERDTLELALFFFFITAISWLSNREMERALVRARKSEKALLQERDMLEIRVEERTQEVLEMQKDKGAQLYRFAEFGKLSSGAFHDLMNSLNVVVAQMERLEHDPDHFPETQSYVARAVSTSKRIGNYVAAVRKQIADNDLLSHFSVEKEINDAVDMLHFRAREFSVTFAVSIPEDIVLYGNAVQFYQIILNLLGNAVDACEHLDQKGLVSISARRENDTAIITVQDNGCGIDQDIIETIFTSFFTTKPYGKGIGLGLSHTKEMVEQTFNGTITVQSQKDVGTLFTVTIPIN